MRDRPISPFIRYPVTISGWGAATMTDGEGVSAGVAEKPMIWRGRGVLP